MGGIGWMVEDHLVEIVNLWRRGLARELPGVADPALGYAAPVFLRELSRALRDDPAASANPFRRCELLIKVAPAEGPAGVVHEFRLLRRSLWEVLRAHGRLVSPQERTIADEKIDEAIATAIGRLAERPQEREARLRATARTEPARGRSPAGEPRTAARSSGASVPSRLTPREQPQVPLALARPARASLATAVRTSTPETAPAAAGGPPPLPIAVEAIAEP